MDGHIFQFNNSCDIGREGQLKLPVDRFISRRHARLHLQGATVFLEDLSSTNGTFVDDERLEGQTELSNGKVFRIGRTWLEITW